MDIMYLVTYNTYVFFTYRILIMLFIFICYCFFVLLLLLFHRADHTYSIRISETAPQNSSRIFEKIYVEVWPTVCANAHAPVYVRVYICAHLQYLYIRVHMSAKNTISSFFRNQYLSIYYSKNRLCTLFCHELQGENQYKTLINIKLTFKNLTFIYILYCIYIQRQFTCSTIDYSNYVILINKTNITTNNADCSGLFVFSKHSYMSWYAQSQAHCSHLSSR